jgi:hypothetical protein
LKAILPVSRKSTTASEAFFSFKLNSEFVIILKKCGPLVIFRSSVGEDKIEYELGSVSSLNRQQALEFDDSGRMMVDECEQKPFMGFEKFNGEGAVTTNGEMDGGHSNLATLIHATLPMPTPGPSNSSNLLNSTPLSILSGVGLQQQQQSGDSSSSGGGNNAAKQQPRQSTYHLLKFGKK